MTSAACHGVGTARARALLPALALLAAALTGCGGGPGDEPATPSSPAALAPATSLNTPLPAGWPAELTLPEGSTVTSTQDSDGIRSVSFDSQQLAADIAAFVDRELAAAGFEKGTSTTAGASLSVGYTKGPEQARLDIVDAGATTATTIAITEVSEAPTTS